ncbi:MAG: amidohydrolase family protein, partial [Nitrososphaerales archaeon]
DRGFDETVHPVHGIKSSILSRSDKNHLSAYMRSSALSMLRKGITTFADFREDGLDGVALLKDALSDLEIRCVRLGRPAYYFDAQSAKRNEDLPEEAKKEAELVLKEADGFGISGANEYSDTALRYLAERARSHNKLLGIHAAEAEPSHRYSVENFGRDEVSRIAEHLMPDFVVHMTNATDEEIKLVSSKNIGVVVCPRANGVLGVGVPRVAAMLRSGCKLALGTDNVMLNSPDLFRELDYLWKVSRAVEHASVPARELLKMVTVNPAELLRLDGLGCIEEGMTADAVFVDTHSLDLEPMHDPHLSIVHRASESAIRSVMIGGRMVHGSL